MPLRKSLALLAKLATPARAWNAWKLRRGLRRRPEVPDYLPLAIDVEPNVRCNLKCEMCQVTTWTRTQPDMTVERFSAILDKLPSVVKVKLQGMGEPTLNRLLPEMVSIAKGRGLYVQTTTNGTLLGKERGRALLESGIDQIYVSIDGATAATHEAIRAGSSFEKTIANVRALVALRGSRRTPAIEAWCVGQRANAAELPALVRLIAELKLDRLTMQHDLSDWGKPEFRDRCRERSLDGENDLGALLSEAHGIARQLGLPFSVHTGNRFDLAKGERCPWPWYSAYVTVEGAVSPCCFLADPDVVKLGDLGQQSFEEIWRGEPYRQFRRAHASGTPPAVCRQCYRNLPPV